MKPDIEVSSGQALITAQIKALEKLRAASQDSFRIQSYNWTLDGIKARNYPVVIDASILKSFVGRYGSENIMKKEVFAISLMIAVNSRLSPSRKIVSL